MTGFEGDIQRIKHPRPALGSHREDGSNPRSPWGFQEPWPSAPLEFSTALTMFGP